MLYMIEIAADFQLVLSNEVVSVLFVEKPEKEWHYDYCPPFKQFKDHPDLFPQPETH